MTDIIVSLAVNTEKSIKFGSVSDTNREDLNGVGGSVGKRGQDLAGDCLDADEHGEQRGVKGYLDLLGELKQYRIVLSHT